MKKQYAKYEIERLNPLGFDQLIYKLLRLTEEEIKIVEGE